MNEALIKAIDSLDFVVSDLRDVLHKSRTVEGLIVLGLIERAAKLKVDTQNLRAAQAVRLELIKIMEATA